MRGNSRRPIGDRWEIYRTISGWHWDHRASNGHLIGASIKAYASRSSCIQNAMRHGMREPYDHGCDAEPYAVAFQHPTQKSTPKPRPAGLWWRHCSSNTRISNDWRPPTVWHKPRAEAHPDGFSERDAAFNGSETGNSDSTWQVYVYILASKRNGTLHTGVTGDLYGHLFEHWNDLKRGFTPRHDEKTLIWFEVHDLITDAIAREKSIKKWSRQRKIDLIEATNPDWEDVSHSLMWS